MTTSPSEIKVMPYSMMVGQEDLKLALELAFIAPKIGGVLLSGDRGTGKSTLVRSFGVMVNQKQPITLPINATEDRVVGGWDIQKLIKDNEPKSKEGLLEQAKDSILYIDEVNLLDDRIVNIILDVSSTGILTVEHEGQDRREQIDFCLVGTMNPEEGGLRPQLLDRFGLMVEVVTVQDEEKRSEILQNVLAYEAVRFAEKKQGLANADDSVKVEEARRKDIETAGKLIEARERFQTQKINELAVICSRVAKAFGTEGHRADYILALAAMARASLRGVASATVEDVLRVARFALQHRQAGGNLAWSEDREHKVKEELNISTS